MSSKRRNKKRMIMEKKRTEEFSQASCQPVAASVAVQKTVSNVENTVAPATDVYVAPQETAQMTEVFSTSQETVTGVEAMSAVEPQKKEPVKNLYLQYNDLEFSDHLLFEASVNDYCQKTGTPVEEIHVVNLYVKPQEGKAYYVINNDGEKTGSIDL